MASPVDLGSVRVRPSGDVPLTKETVEDVPWNCRVAESRHRQGVTGVYGVGLKINVKGKFDVLEVTGLLNQNDEGDRIAR
jgi:hypothetical protein